jgi:hypothetical protein
MGKHPQFLKPQTAFVKRNSQGHKVNEISLDGVFADLAGGAPALEQFKIFRTVVSAVSEKQHLRDAVAMPES